MQLGASFMAGPKHTQSQPRASVVMPHETLQATQLDRQRRVNCIANQAALCYTFASLCLADSRSFTYFLKASVLLVEACQKSLWRSL